jgi:hypothetical protein
VRKAAAKAAPCPHPGLPEHRPEALPGYPRDVPCFRASCPSPLPPPPAPGPRRPARAPSLPPPGRAAAPAAPAPGRGPGGPSGTPKTPLAPGGFPPHNREQPIGRGPGLNLSRPGPDQPYGPDCTGPPKTCPGEGGCTLRGRAGPRAGGRQPEDSPGRAARPGGSGTDLSTKTGRERRDKPVSARFSGRALGHVALLVVAALVAAACGTTQTAQAPSPRHPAPHRRPREAR